MKFLSSRLVVPRIGVMVNSETVSLWQALLVQQLQNACQVPVIVFNTPTSNPTKTRTTYALKGLQQLDALTFKAASNPTMPVNLIEHLVEGAPISFHWANQPVALSQVNATQLDILLDFTERPLVSTWYSVARLGVWRYFYSANGSLISANAGLPEYYGGNRLVFSGLRSWTSAHRKPKNVFVASTSTHPASLTGTVYPLLWRLSEYLLQTVQTLIYEGYWDEPFLDELEQRFAPATQRMEQIQVPDWQHQPNKNVVRQYGSRLLRKFHRSRTLSEQWCLLVGTTTTPLAIHRLGRFTKLLPPPDRYWSDPFVVEHKGAHYVFVEEGLFKQGKAHIACLQVTAQGGYSPPITVLDRPYSVSYPFIFRYRNTFYLIPETAQNGQVELYRCKEFPYSWEFDRVIMRDVFAFDTTIFEYHDRWWLMQSRAPNRYSSPNGSLYLFYAESPLATEWTAHPYNPIVTEADRARPAGRPFVWGNKLYRPSQNCAGAEGRGLNISEITQISTQHYQEHGVVRCVPQGRYQLGGLQTLAFNDQVTVLDGLHLFARTRD